MSHFARITLPVAFGCIVVILCATLVPVIDPDLYWHLKTGELIRSSGTIPTNNLYSLTESARPWIVQGWLSDWTLSAAWGAFGKTGVRVLVAALVLGTWLCIYRAVQLYVERSESALLLSAAGIAICSPFLVPRPYLVSNLGVAATLLVLLHYRRNAKAWTLAWLPVLFAVWPNFHFGFVTGLGVLALFIACDAADRLLPLDRTRAEPGRLVPWTGPALVALCLLALGLNPDGYRVIGSTIQMIGVSAPSVVVEWQSPDFKSPNQVAFLVAVLAFFGARALAGRCRSWLDIGVPAAVIMAGFQMRRMLPLLALTLAVFAARALRDWRSRQPARAAAAPAALDRLALNRELDPRITGAIHVVAIIAVAAIGVAIGPAVDDHFERQARLILPRHAADFIVEHDVRGRLFNTYNGGGYLIYRLFPGHRVFIDGRQTPYSPGLLADDNVIESGAPGWYERLERVAPELVLCETASPLHQLLELRDEFRQVYSDSYFSVLLRNDGRLPALPTVPTAGPPT